MILFKKISRWLWTVCKNRKRPLFWSLYRLWCSQK